MQDAEHGSLTVTEEDRQGARESVQHGGRGYVIYVESHISLVLLSMGEATVTRL